MADTLAGRRVVMESVAHFVDDIADRIEIEILPPATEPDALEPGAAPPESADGPVIPASGRHRRVFLPVDGLDRRPGGGTGLRQCLAAEPGVIGVELDAVAAMAVVDYDATVSSLGRQVAQQVGFAGKVAPPARCTPKFLDMDGLCGLLAG